MPISIETQTAIEKFNAVIRRAIQARSKDVRLDISDASILMGELSNVMTRLAVLENGAASAGIADGHQMDGGKF